MTSADTAFAIINPCAGSVQSAHRTLHAAIRKLHGSAKSHGEDEALSTIGTEGEHGLQIVKLPRPCKAGHYYRPEYVEHIDTHSAEWRDALYDWCCMRY